MFSNALKQTPLTDEIASEFYPNINACPYDGDNSFCTTLRTILFNRLKDGEAVNVNLSVVKKEKIEISLRPETADTIKYEDIFYREAIKDFLYIRVLEGYNDKDFELIMNKAKRHIFNFKYQESVSFYLSQAGYKTAVYICESTQKVIMFTLGMSFKYWHYMQSALPKLFPWHFSTPLNEFEKKLLHSLTLKTSKTYMELITAHVDKYDFRGEKLRRLLNNFGISWEETHLETLRAERTRIGVEFIQFQEKISQIIARDRELQASIIGLELSVSQGDKTGLTDYFICNKSLHLCEVTGDKLRYIVTSRLEYFDQSIFEKYFGNLGSYFHSDIKPSNFTYDAYKVLMRAIFGDEISIKVRVCAEFELSLTGTLTPQQNSEHITMYAEWLPHPHINDHACLGNNSIYINQMMEGKRYIEAIEQSVAAVKNINFSDTIVAKKFVGKLCSSGSKFLELPGGQVVSPKEAAAWLMNTKGDI